MAKVRAYWVTERESDFRGPTDTIRFVLAYDANDAARQVEIEHISKRSSRGYVVKVEPVKDKNTEVEIDAAQMESISSDFYRTCNDVRLDVDTWLGLNDRGDLPRHAAIEIRDRLLNAIQKVWKNGEATQPESDGISEAAGEVT